MSFAALLWKDLRREVRSKEVFQAGLLLVALFFVVTLFAFQDLRSEPRAATLVLWLPLLYAGAAALGRGMASEADRGTLELLRAAPVPRLWHGLSRTLLHILVLLLLAAATLLVAAGLWDIPLGLPLALVFLLSTLGIAIVGSLAAGLAAQAQARELLLPILLVPLLVPLLLSGVQATLAALAGATVAEVRPALWLLLGYDLLAAAGAWLLWPILLEGD